jgi:hypothetical protein
LLASVSIYETSEQIPPPLKKKALEIHPSWTPHKGQHFAVLSQRQVEMAARGGHVIHPTLFSYQLVLPPLSSRALPAICRRPVAKFGTHNETRSGSTTMQIVTITTKQNRFCVFFFLFYSPTYLLKLTLSHRLPFQW